MRAEMRKAYKTLIGKPQGMRPLRRPKSKWEDNIKIYLKELVLSVWLTMGTGGRFLWERK
jgi:hypothetical protein